MKLPLILLSHVALGVAGWAIAREFRSTPVPLKAENPRARSTRIRPSNVPGDELLRSIESRLEKARIAKEQLASQPGAREKILAALTGLTLPPDPYAAISALLTAGVETKSIQAAALFVLWAKSDPVPALKFASECAKFREMLCDDEALELVGEFIDPELASAVAMGEIREPIIAGLARQLISSRTVEDLTILLKGMEKDLKRSLLFQIGAQWPRERIDDFGRLATAMDDPEMLRLVRRQLPIEGMADWMIKYIDQHPDPEFAREIRESDFNLTLVSAQPAIPLEDRLDVVIRNFASRSLSTEFTREDATKHLAFRDVDGFFDDDGPDLRYAFHHGKIEASDILAKLNVRFPEHAAAGRLPALLYQELGREDPDRSAFLIADLPIAERARLIAENDWSFCSLDSLSRVLDQFPDSEDDAVLAYRAELWEELVDFRLHHYGKDYIRWILTLPDSRDRKMALGVIADEIERPSNPDDKVAEIREIVGDIPLRDTP